MDFTLYDSKGRPTAYSEDGEHIFLFSGAAVAYLHGRSVYSYSGRHLGRFQAGWMRDNSGNCAFFTDDAASGGPARPAKTAKPAKSAKTAKPAKMARSAAGQPARQSAWSELSGKHFFEQ